MLVLVSIPITLWTININMTLLLSGPDEIAVISYVAFNRVSSINKKTMFYVTIGIIRVQVGVYHEIFYEASMFND